MKSDKYNRRVRRRQPSPIVRSIRFVRSVRSVRSVGLREVYPICPITVPAVRSVRCVRSVRRSDSSHASQPSDPLGPLVRCLRPCDVPPSKTRHSPNGRQASKAPVRWTLEVYLEKEAPFKSQSLERDARQIDAQGFPRWDRACRIDSQGFPR